MNLTGAFAEGVKVHNMFGVLEKDGEDANVDIEDKEGRKEEEVKMPPGLEESDGEVEEESADQWQEACTRLLGRNEGLIGRGGPGD